MNTIIIISIALITGAVSSRMQNRDLMNEEITLLSTNIKGKGPEIIIEFNKACPCL